MTSDEPHPDRCGAQCRDGGHCEKYPVGDADRCRLHGGIVGDGHGAPEGNQNATRHGLHADPANVLDDLAERDPEAYEWVCKKYDSYLDAAPFGDGSAKADQLKQIATQEYIIWKATGFQLKSGVVVEADAPAGAGLAERVAENPVNRPLDRMQRTVVNRLKELGVLDDPVSQQAAAATDKIGALRELMGEADTE